MIHSTALWYSHKYSPSSICALRLREKVELRGNNGRIHGQFSCLKGVVWLVNKLYWKYSYGDCGFRYNLLPTKRRYLLLIQHMQGKIIWISTYIVVN